MPYYRQIIEALPETITVPSALRNRRVEIIMLPLDEIAVNGKPAAVDANGWPEGFFEETFGSMPDFPERELQGEYETREEFA